MFRKLQSIKNIYHLIQAFFAAVYFGFPGRKLTVIGVTGTDGKTTTSSLIYHVLKSSGINAGLISTVAAYIGDDKVDTGFHVTTPSSWQLQRLVKRMVNQHITHLVLEATSHGLDQHRLGFIRIQTAVVTNITHEHLDYHQTYSNYVTAKAKILRQAQSAILNADDASFETLLKYLPKNCQLLPYSLKENTNPDLLPEENFSLLLNSISHKFPQKYNQENALSAFLAVSAVGLTTRDFTKSLPTFVGVDGRMQTIPNHKGLNIFVDFAHTPNALKKVLTAAKEITQGKLIIVFGAAGLRDKSKRPMMGKIAADLADEIIITAEDPRTEDVRSIIEQIKSGATTNRGHLHGIPNRRQAIKFALSLSRKGDTVIICGKGHEQSLNLDGKHELPWSDVKVISQLLV